MLSQSWKNDNLMGRIKEKSPIMLSQYCKNSYIDGEPKIILLFGGTKNIFVYFIIFIFHVLNLKFDNSNPPISMLFPGKI